MPYDPDSAFEAAFGLSATADYDVDAAYEAAFGEPAAPPQGAFARVGTSVLRGIGRGVGGALSGLGEAAAFMERQIPLGGATEGDKTALGRAGQFITGKAEEYFPRGEDVPGVAGFLQQDLPEGVGQIATMIGPGVAAKGLGAAATGARNLATISGLAQGSGSLATEAREAGASPEDVNVAAGVGAGLGLLDTIVPGRVLSGSGVGTLARRIGVNALTEAGTEGLQTVGENITARELYDPTRDVTRGVGTAMAVGGVIGGGLGPFTGGDRPPPAQPIAEPPPLLARPDDPTASATPVVDEADPTAAYRPREEVPPAPDLAPPPPPREVDIRKKRGGKFEVFGEGFKSRTFDSQEEANAYANRMAATPAPPPQFSIKQKKDGTGFDATVRVGGKTVDSASFVSREDAEAYLRGNKRYPSGPPESAVGPAPADPSGIPGEAIRPPPSRSAYDLSRIEAAARGESLPPIPEPPAGPFTPEQARLRAIGAREGEAAPLRPEEAIYDPNAPIGPATALVPSPRALARTPQSFESVFGPEVRPPERRPRRGLPEPDLPPIDLESLPEPLPVAREPRGLPSPETVTRRPLGLPAPPREGRPPSPPISSLGDPIITEAERVARARQILRDYEEGRSEPGMGPETITPPAPERRGLPAPPEIPPRRGLPAPDLRGRFLSELDRSGAKPADVKRARKSLRENGARIEAAIGRPLESVLPEATTFEIAYHEWLNRNRAAIPGKPPKDQPPEPPDGPDDGGGGQPTPRPPLPPFRPAPQSPGPRRPGFMDRPQVSAAPAPAASAPRGEAVAEPPRPQTGPEPVPAPQARPTEPPASPAPGEPAKAGAPEKPKRGPEWRETASAAYNKIRDEYMANYETDEKRKYGFTFDKSMQQRDVVTPDKARTQKQAERAVSIAREFMYLEDERRGKGAGSRDKKYTVKTTSGDVEVKGRPETVPGADAFGVVPFSHVARDGRIRISDEKTGLAIGSGDTVSQAIEDASRILARELERHKPKGGDRVEKAEGIDTRRLDQLQQEHRAAFNRTDLAQGEKADLIDKTREAYELEFSRVDKAIREKNKDPNREFAGAVYRAAANALHAGQTVNVRTGTRTTVIEPKNRDALRWNQKAGQIELRRGKNWDAVAFSPLDALAAELGVVRGESSRIDRPNKLEVNPTDLGRADYIAAMGGGEDADFHAARHKAVVRNAVESGELSLKAARKIGLDRDYPDLFPKGVDRVEKAEGREEGGRLQVAPEGRAEPEPPAPPPAEPPPEAVPVPGTVKRIPKGAKPLSEPAKPLAKQIADPPPPDDANAARDAIDPDHDFRGKLGFFGGNVPIAKTVGKLIRASADAAVALPGLKYAVTPMAARLREYGPVGRAVEASIRRAQDIAKEIHGPLESRRVAAQRRFVKNGRATDVQREAMKFNDRYKPAHKDAFYPNAQVIADGLVPYKQGDPLSDAVRELTAIDRAVGNVAKDRFGVKVLEDGSDFNPRETRWGRYHSRQFREAIEAGAGNPVYDKLIEVLAAENGWKPDLAKKKLADAYQTVVKGDPKGKSVLQHAQFEFRREIEKFPAFIRVDGNLVPMLEADPAHYLERNTRMQAHRLGLVAVFGQQTRSGVPVGEDGSVLYNMVKALEKEAGPRRQEALSDLRESIAAYNNIALEESGENIRPDNPINLFFEGRSRGGEIYKAGESVAKTALLSGAAIPNVTQPLVLLHQAGARRFLRGLADTIAHPRAAKAFARNAGAFEESLADFRLKTADGRWARNFARAVRDTGYRAFLFKQVNDFNSILAANVGKQMVADMKAGKFDDPETLAGLLDFTPAQIKSLQSGTADTSLYNAVVTRMTENTQFTGGTGAVQSKMQNSAVARAIFWFTSYFQNTLYRTARVLRENGAALESGNPRAQMRATRNLLGMIAGPAAAVVGADLLRALVSGDDLGDDETLRGLKRAKAKADSGDTFGATMTAGKTYGALALEAFFGPAVKAAEFWEPDKPVESAARLLGPAKYAIDAIHMWNQSGRYADKLPMEMVAEFVKSSAPVLRTGDKLRMAAMGLRDPRLDAAQRRYYRFMEKHGPKKNYPDKEDYIAFRANMKKAADAIEAHRIGDAMGFIGTALADKAIQTGDADEAMEAARRSLRARRLTQTLLPSENDSPAKAMEKAALLEKYLEKVGADDLSVLGMHDALLDAVAGAL